ncbi:hypothetical protein SAMN05443634_105166 [Chishuiella changwenlii]|uniref:Uncharacterized protein n=1 Tax=Chishuiella changwenlii TaxID=1434701 RepID=A0A1M6X9D0_9FLAO|nr:hypothetical protein [Chishuiella changwenlii]GGF00187.1 hypothetical protein GCM10010984_17200 [Chishuiella changwenlii]SHL02612.1 hypothetical protein SAMN05443634_105166 [Chishuiella changwenlii]
MEITDQNEVINAILKSLDSSIIGIGIKERYNVIKVHDETTTRLIFSLKEGKISLDTDFFWLGWNANQYY